MLFRSDWAGAEKDYRRGIELDPRDPDAHFRFSTVLMFLGRFDEARSELEQAQRLDPLSGAISARFPRLSYLARQYDRALEDARKAREFDAAFFGPHEVTFMGLSHLQKKMYDQAIAELNNAVELSGETPEMMAYLGYAYAVAGQRGEAEKVLAKLRDRAAGHKRVAGIYYGIVYMGLGENDRALDLLEQASKDREGRLLVVKVDPIYDSLRNQARFQKLLKEMNLM